MLANTDEKAVANEAILYRVRNNVLQEDGQERNGRCKVGMTDLIAAADVLLSGKAAFVNELEDLQRQNTDHSSCGTGSRAPPY